MIAPLLAAAAVGAPAPCSPADTRRVVAAFVGAWNRGDLAAVDRLIARPPVFKWFSSGAPGARIGAASANRRALLRYVAARHARHDRIRLRWFRHNGSDVRTDGRYGHFEYELERSADDWNGGAAFVAPGKGAVNCSGGRTTIAVWSMSGG